MGSKWLVVTAVSGFTVVALGAFGAHGLRDVLDVYHRSVYEKAVLYQMFHTLAMGLVGLCLLREQGRPQLLNLAGRFFFAGIVLFSGSLYLLAVTGMNWLGAVTPVGGVSFLIGWALLGLAFRR